MEDNMRTHVYLLTASVLLLLTSTYCGSAFAHHSNAPFDLSKIVTYEATVTRYEWKNPHVFIQVETTDARGQKIILQVEGDGIPILLPYGWSGDSLTVGDRVKVEASPPKIAGRRSVLGRSITKKDGTVLVPNPEFIRSTPPQSAYVASGIAGPWLPRWESFRGLSAKRSEWKYTDEGQRNFQRTGSIANPQAHCIPFSSPRIMVYPTHTAIEVLPDRVLINVDWMSVERVVYTDGRGHPADGKRTRQGHSIGRWEGDTLVIDTTLFTEDSMGGLVFMPSGPDKRIEEWLSLGDDGKTIDYKFVVEDPKYLAQLVSGSGVWDYRPDLEASGTECDLEIARRYLEANE